MSSWTSRRLGAFRASSRSFRTSQGMTASTTDSAPAACAETIAPPFRATPCVDQLSRSKGSLYFAPPVSKKAHGAHNRGRAAPSSATAPSRAMSRPAGVRLTGARDRHRYPTLSRTSSSSSGPVLSPKLAQRRDLSNVACRESSRERFTTCMGESMLYRGDEGTL